MQEADFSKRIFDVVSNISNVQYLFVRNMRNGCTNWSKEAVDFFGLSTDRTDNDEVVFTNMVHPDEYKHWMQEYNDALDIKKDGFFYTCQLKNAKGEYLPCTTKAKMVLGDRGEKFLLVGSITVHSEEEKYDVITELPKLQDFLKAISKEKSTHKECLTLAMEIKRFGSVNALYGYNFGSKVLYEAASLIKKILNKQGEVFRLDGTVFSVLLHSNDIAYATAVFDEIRDALAKFSLDGCALNLELWGGSLYTKNYTVSSQTIYSCLLSALEKAKEEDLYELVALDDESHETNYKMMELLNAVKAGIRNNCEGFYLCYQPFVSTVTGRIIGAEALVRWRNPDYGVVSPGRFVPQLESHPCFYDLSMWILRRAIKDSKEILNELPGFFINVNMSYSQLERPEFRHDVIAILEEYDFPKKNLQLELTERCRNLNMEYLKEQLEFFRSYDIKIALDDYGTGNSTINLLCELPITCVKIDQTFILNILGKSSNRVVVDSTVQCAKSLGLNVCLEGVENQEIKDFIEKYSANYHQGYFYSRPVEFDKFKKFLSDFWKVSEVSLIKGNPKDIYGTNNILSMIPGGFLIYADDETEKILSVNETILDIFECETLDEFIELTGGSFKGIVHPEDYQDVRRNILQQVRENEANMDFVKYRIITKKGAVKYMRDYGHLVKDEHDVDLYYVFMVEEHV